MKTFLKIILFAFILGFLLYLIPGVNDWVNTRLKTQLFSSDVPVAYTGTGSGLATQATQYVQPGSKLPISNTTSFALPTISSSTPAVYTAPSIATPVLPMATSSTIYAIVPNPDPKVFDSALTYYQDPKGNVFFAASFDKGADGCLSGGTGLGTLVIKNTAECPNSPPSNYPFTVYGKSVQYCPNSSGCFGYVQTASAPVAAVGTTSFISKSELLNAAPIVAAPTAPAVTDTMSNTPEVIPVTVSPPTVAVSTPPEVVNVAVTPPPQPIATTPPPEIPVTPPPPPPPPPDGSKLDCPVAARVCPTGNKEFDYGALIAFNPYGDLPVDTAAATHFISDHRPAFKSIWMGDDVDAPELVANDTDASDQDGLVKGADGKIDPVKSTDGKITLKNIHNVRKDYGTIVVGRWEKGTSTYTFKVLAVFQVSQDGPKAVPSVHTDNGESIIPFSESGTDMQDGWLTVLYFDGEGNYDANVPGSNQLAINGMPNLGYSSSTMKGWSGTNPALDQIIYGAILDPLDPSRRPGEVEDYLYCRRGPTGFRYYLPTDPQYKVDCGQQAPQTQTVTSLNQPMNITFTCQQTQSQFCNTATSTGTFTGTGTAATPVDNRPIATIIQDLYDTFESNPANNTPEGRLRMMYKFMRTTVPIL